MNINAPCTGTNVLTEERTDEEELFLAMKGLVDRSHSVGYDITAITGNEENFFLTEVLDNDLICSLRVTRVDVTR